ncbi:acyl-CoA thioesterase [Alteromonas oceanisediminis]|uniref:acyl-CoA thioesterase n=1 Tax=Alteromonas oceanisediminis TaxID=2836180 RepID=UPI001BDB0792|nr:acyl-CoA thioesterase [Alteromonas oceanisediminis]MBT0587439.1 acyl-CoA thioesterase [Alteromonas oceanisediminis]
MSELVWPLPQPFVADWEIQADVIDHYGHVNNVAYIVQLEKLAWLHSNALGLSIDQYRSLDRGMAIRRHEVDYLLPCHTGQTIACATWIVKCDSRLNLTRQFEFICRTRGKPVFTARTDFVCIALSSGAPKRMPEAFKSAYAGAMVSDAPQHRAEAN